MATLVIGETKRFRAFIEFDNPEELPNDFKLKNFPVITVRKILTLPLSEMKMWMQRFNLEVTFGNFWFFCSRFERARYEHGDVESYEKAKLIFEKLKTEGFKLNYVPKLHFASHQENKIELIKEALVTFGAPLKNFPPLEGTHKSVEYWNKWLDSKRDPKTVEAMAEYSIAEGEHHPVKKILKRHPKNKSL